MTIAAASLVPMWVNWYACDMDIVKSLYGKSSHILAIQFVTYVLEHAWLLVNKFINIAEGHFLHIP